MKKYIAVAGLVGAIAAGVVYSQSQKNLPTKVPINQKSSYTFDYSEGTCSKNTNCSWSSQGCGGGHGICTNTPDKYKDMVSTCDVNPDFPSNKGFTCGCVESEGKCGWKK